jgi:hypothetical protein
MDYRKSLQFILSESDRKREKMYIFTTLSCQSKNFPPSTSHAKRFYHLSFSAPLNPSSKTEMGRLKTEICIDIFLSIITIDSTQSPFFILSTRRKYEHYWQVLLSIAYPWL